MHADFNNNETLSGMRISIFTNMIKITSPDALLLRLAKSGDPSAFYTLVAPHAKATYLSLRSNSGTHKDAMTAIIPFLKKLYREFWKEPAFDSFSLWYGVKQKRRFHISEKTDDVFTLPENVTESDFAHFDDQIKLLFQRNYGAVTRKQNKFIPAFLAGVFIKSGILRFAAICILAIAVVLGSLFFLYKKNIDFSIGVRTKGSYRTFEISHIFDSNFILNHLPKNAIATLPKAAPVDSMLVADTTNPVSGEPVPQKKITPIPSPVQKSVLNSTSVKSDSVVKKEIKIVIPQTPSQSTISTQTSQSPTTISSPRKTIPSQPTVKTTAPTDTSTSASPYHLEN
jgi:hypothetical protein